MARFEQYKETMKGGFYAAHNIHDYHPQHPFNTLHTHEELELLMPIRGNLNVQIDGISYSPRPDSIILINDKELHRITHNPGEPYERYVICFSAEYIRSILPDQPDLLACFYTRSLTEPHLLPLSASQAVDFRAAFHKLVALNSSTGSDAPWGQSLRKKLLLSQLLLDLNEAYFRYHNIFPTARPGSPNLIYPIIEYVHANYRKNLSLADLADRFFVSKFHLSSRFKQTTGMTVFNYITWCRINKAKELLLSGWKVSQISDFLGYSSAAHFSRVFKKEEQISPKQFQQKNLAI